MSNQYIYLKGKLVGPVEKEQPKFNGDYFLHYGPQKRWEQYLESLPSIEVHESLKDKLVDNGRYELYKDFQILRIDSVGLENDNTGAPTAFPLNEEKERVIEEIMADWRKGIYPDLSGWSDKEKNAFVSGFVSMVAKETMMVFYALGLKTHIDCALVNEPTGESFKFSFVKQPPQPERLFTLQEMKECWNAGEVYGRTDAYWNCGKATSYEIENTPDREEYFAIKFKIKPSDIQ